MNILMNQQKNAPLVHQVLFTIHHQKNVNKKSTKMLLMNVPKINHFKLKRAVYNVNYQDILTTKPNNVSFALKDLTLVPLL